MQVGVPPGVGSDYDRIEVLRGWGLSSLDTRGYNTVFDITQRPQICRSSGYWTIERCFLAEK